MWNNREVPLSPMLLFYILYKYLKAYFCNTVTTHNFRILKWVTLFSLPLHIFALPSYHRYWLWEIKYYGVKMVSNNMIFMPHSWKSVLCCIRIPTCRQHDGLIRILLPLSRKKEWDENVLQMKYLEPGVTSLIVVLACVAIRCNSFDRTHIILS